MSCKTYIEQLTSGQLAQGSLTDKLWATQHRLICRRCRAFTRNNAVLDQVLAHYRENLQTDYPLSRDHTHRAR